MIVLGLTGSIGMGKSTAAGLLSHMGCAVHNADACVYRALEPGGAGYEEVAVTFPDVWSKKTRRIDRQKLAGIIFDDEEARLSLEAILHPIVQAEERKFLLAQQRLGRKITVLDIPLLYETGADARCDYTIVVSAPETIQRRRVLSRPHMTEEKFEKILSSQMPDSEKRARADFIVETGLGLARTCEQLKKILESIHA